MENYNFWDYNVWGFIGIIGILLLAMLLANLIKKTVKFLRNSLIPTSVLGGLILLIISFVYEEITGNNIFNTAFFNGQGLATLEILTYHSLALGFIASALKPAKQKFTKERNIDIFNSGMTTVASYLLQAVLGMGFTLIVSLLIVSFKDYGYTGTLLTFGFGQGTGQALNYGNIYETEYGFVGGKSFGLTVAAIGFLSASIGGVIHLNILKRKGKIHTVDTDVAEKLTLSDIQSAEEIAVNGSIDKLTIQFAIIFLTYAMTFGFMFGLGELIPGFRATLYGFNFLFGVIMAGVVKAFMNHLRKHKIVKKIYVNDFLMNRISGFFFDIMVIAGIGAIRIDVLKSYWWIILLLCAIGAVSTYLYNRFIAKKLFPTYSEEQFMVMYGMLTGTASTGIILLREIDKDFSTPAGDNLVYQQIPAIIFGFPLMFLALLAPKNPLLTLGILFGFFIVINLILFRKFIFKKKDKQE